MKASTKVIRPLLGRLHTRQQPDNIPFGDTVARHYFGTVDGTFVRAHGFRRFLDSANYCNQDLHDQLIQIQFHKKPSDNGCSETLLLREYKDERITALYQVKDSFGARYFLAATASRIYQLNEISGNWRLLADGLSDRVHGMDDVSTRFRMAFLNDYVIATNGDGPVLHYLLNSDNTGCEISAFKPIQDLLNVGIKKVRIVTQFEGRLFLLNAYDGARPLPGLVMWSRPNMPLVFDPMNQSGGDAPSWHIILGHNILNAVEFNGQLVIFTDKGIISCSFQGLVDAPFAFNPVYSSDGGHRCLAFPNTLVTTGDFIMYLGRDDIYVMSATSFGPESIEWIRDAAGEMFREINLGECNGHVAGVRPEQHEIWISYCRGNRRIPDKTLVLNYKYQTAYYRNDGFTAFATYQGDNRPSFRDFLNMTCICSGEEAQALYVKEGLPCRTAQCNNPPQYIYTAQTTTIEDPDDPQNPIVTEDFSVLQASGNSLCSILGDARIEDFCKTCNEQTIFAGVYSFDNTIKDISPDVFALETLINRRTGNSVGMASQTPAPSAGDYLSSGYNSEAIFGPLTFNDHKAEVNVRNVVLHVETYAEYAPCAVGVAFGHSKVPVDASNGSCGIIWQPMEYRLLECPEPPAEDSLQTRPSFTLNIPVYVTGGYLYLKIVVVGLEKNRDISSNKVSAVGGKCRLFSIEMTYQQRT